MGIDLFVVVNAACKDADIARMRPRLSLRFTVDVLDDRALLALQGPKAEAVLARWTRRGGDAVYGCGDSDLERVAVWASRSGYTGEDGYEISVPAAHAERWRAPCWRMKRLRPSVWVRATACGLRRVCAFMGRTWMQAPPCRGRVDWAIQKVRRAGGARAGGFPGADVILAEIGRRAARNASGSARGARADARRRRTFCDAEGGDADRDVTSGGFGPTWQARLPWAMCQRSARSRHAVYGDVRGKRLPVAVAKLPFVRRKLQTITTGERPHEIYRRT